MSENKDTPTSNDIVAEIEKKLESMTYKELLHCMAQLMANVDILMPLVVGSTVSITKVLNRQVDILKTFKKFNEDNEELTKWANLANQCKSGAADYSA